jgi:RHS repeat-associated protein
LPQRIQFGYGHNTEYFYDASGMKRWAIHKTSKKDLAVPMGQTRTLSNSNLLSSLTTDYCGNGHIIYENGVLKRILTPEGFLTKTNKFVYHYYLRDHLGNNRSVISWDGSGYTNNHWNTAQETNHYPFGMSYQSSFYGDNYQPEYQPYKFGGKELDAMHGLNWSDFDSRYYDGIVPRFTTPDPMAEKYYSISPYAYCGNNPVNRIDPTGMWIVGLDENPVTYDEKNGWSVNASEDVKKIGNAMMRTSEGKEVVNNMIDTEYGISMNYKDGFSSENRNKLGEAKISHEGDKVTGVEINLYDGKIKEEMAINDQLRQSGFYAEYPANTDQLVKDRDNLLKEHAPSLTERIGQIGAHEGTHATDRNAMPFVVGRVSAEQRALSVEMKAIRSTMPIRPNLNSLRIKIR